MVFIELIGTQFNKEKETKGTNVKHERSFVI